MTWLGQVRHIAWKDVRQSRWILGIYIVVVITATARSVAFPFAANGVATSVLFLVVVIGIAAAATIVQSDSPVRSDALWASRPFYPSAMLSAKLLLVLIVILAVPLLGEIAALGTFDVSRADVAFFASQSAVVYALWLLPTVVVAALTRDFRSFVVTLLGIIAGLLLLVGIALVPPSSIAIRVSFTRGGVTLLGTVIGIALLARVYTTHVAHAGVWAVAVTLSASALVAILVGAPPVTVVPGAAAIHAPPQVQIQVTNLDQIARWRQLQVAISVENAPDSLAAGFSTDTAILHLRDGSMVRIAQTFGATTLHIPDLPVHPDSRWLGRDMKTGMIGNFGIPLTDRDARTVARELLAVEVIGSLTLIQPRVIGELPLRAGASMTRDGMRARIARVDYSSDNPTIDLETFSVQREAVPRIALGNMNGLVDAPRFSLVNFTRREAIPLYNRSSSGGGDWLVLPGAPVQQSGARLEVKNGAGSMVPEDTWFRDAKLLIVQWIPVATYPVRPVATLR